MRDPARTHRPAQRGIGSLVVTLLLLFGSSIVVFYLNRSLLFEQKTAANQARSTAALEAADAGIEWATGMLNAPQHIGADCSVDATAAQSFRRRYAQSAWLTTPASTHIVPAAGVRPGCHLDAGVSTCSCPAVPAVGAAALAALDSPSPRPGFTVSFAPAHHPGTATADPDSLEIVSVGCSASSGPCTAGDATADASATVRVILKLAPLLRASPAAALVCGASCTLEGDFRVVNDDPSSPGIAVNAGAALVGGAGRVGGLAGTPPAHAVIAGDTTLAALSSADASCDGDALFHAQFGTTLEAFRTASATTTLGCSTSGDCGAALAAAYEEGWRMFYLPLGLVLDADALLAALGTPTDPVVIVSPARVELLGGQDLHGLVFANDVQIDDPGAGAGVLRGAVVACRDAVASGGGRLVYDVDVLRQAQRAGGALLRVPGSWRDLD